MSTMSFGAASSGFGNTPSQTQQQQLQQTMLMRQTTPSDDEVRSATQDIVGAALNALRQNETIAQQRQAQQQSRPAQRSRRHTVDALPSFSTTLASTRLDAMTDMFLERSMARLQTRPAIMGPRPALTQSSVAQHQQQQFMGGCGGIMSRHQQSLVASIDAEVQAQTQAKVFAAQQQHRQHGRKVSMLGHMGM